MLDWLRQDPRSPPYVVIGQMRLPIVIRRLARARRMTLRLSPDGREVRISIPQWGRTAEAVAFARSRSDWLAARIAAIPPPEPVRAGGTLPYRGESAVITHLPGMARTPRFADGTIALGGAAESIERRLKRWLQAEARRLAEEDLAQYCAGADRPVPPLALSSAHRRWGSCAPDGAIRINWRLIMAPDFVRRSVVAHEVAHLVHFDHSPRFYRLLAEIFEGDVAAANAWLKRFGPTLYQPFG